MWYKSGIPHASPAIVLAIKAKFSLIQIQVGKYLLTLLYCVGECTKCYKHTSFFYFMHTIATGVKCIVGSLSQYKQQINTSKQTIIIIIEMNFTEKFAQ